MDGNFWLNARELIQNTLPNSGMVAKPIVPDLRREGGTGSSESILMSENGGGSLNYSSI